MSLRKKYRVIGLPEPLYLRCKEVVDSEVYGFASVTELVKDAVRRYLESLNF